MTEFITTDTSLPPYMVFPRFLLDMVVLCQEKGLLK